MTAQRRNLEIAISGLCDLAGPLLADALDRGVPTPSLNDPAYRAVCDAIGALTRVAEQTTRD